MTSESYRGLYYRSVLFPLVALLFSQILPQPLFALAGTSPRQLSPAPPRDEVGKSFRLERTSEPLCKASFLLEVDSGEVLYEHNADEKLAPASMVKMLVGYVAMQQIDEGLVNKEDIVAVSGRVSKIGGSQVYLKQGEEFTLGELLEAVMVQSANDASAAIAEHIAGSTLGFVELMNSEARRLGMTSSEFHSPHGLPPAKGQKPDLTTARDMALLGRAIIRDFPELHRLSGINEAGFRDDTFNMRNHNNLLRVYDGCDGIKTGYYREAGFCVTATAERNDVRLIAVTMGCSSVRKRTEEISALFTLGFARYRRVRLVDAGEEMPGGAKVLEGKRSTVPLVTADAAFGTVASELRDKIRQEVVPCGPLRAPVEKGRECGRVSFVADGKTIGSQTLLTGQAVARAGFLERMLAKIKNLL